jgi:hypothetical protein
MTWGEEMVNPVHLFLGLPGLEYDFEFAMLVLTVANNIGLLVIVENRSIFRLKANKAK